MEFDRRIIPPFAGAVVALAAGVVFGGALRPQMIELAGGPQILVTAAGERSTGPGDGIPTIAGHGGRVPDHVLGTDFARALAPEAPPAEDPAAQPEAGPAFVAAADPPAEPPGRYGRPTYDEPEPPHYPSASGGAYLEQDLPEPPDPPIDEDWPPRYGDD